jgi:O-antigen ligase
MKTSIVLWLLLLGGINLFLPTQVFFILMIALFLLLAPIDKSKFYTSSFPTLLPILLLVVLGMFTGLSYTHTYTHFFKDLYRDFFIFSKNIIYFLAGIMLSRFIRNFNEFFKYFLFLAFASSLVHIGLILKNFNSITSLAMIRYVAGYANAVEGVALALCVSRIFSKTFRKFIDDLTFYQKVMIISITISFLLYFSRTLIVLLPVVAFFLTDTLYIRTLFSKKNVKMVKAFALFAILFYGLTLVADVLPADSPVRTLVEKFKNIPEEISWTAKKNKEATKTEIQDHWRGYEAYQGLLKYRNGDAMKKAIGFGFGERIDIGITMKLAGDYYDTIPILHNEYVTLLVKSGILGLFLYLLFLYLVGCTKIKYNRVDDPEIYYSYQMLSALSLVSLLNTYIGFGLLDPTNAAMPIFLGFFWGNIQRNRNAIEDSKLTDNGYS